MRPQLADFLGSPGARGAPSVLETAGGMLTLPDAYALFNRARGMEVTTQDSCLYLAPSRTT